MLCKIADLITEVPAAGDLVPRCQEYLWEGSSEADIIIRSEDFRTNAWKYLTGNDYIYAESGSHFGFHLLRHKGLVLHASAAVYNGKAYLFTAPSGTGKSTHTQLWKKVFGDGVYIINDDKPALRNVDGTWYAYGTPWCGKDRININMKASLAGICFLKQAPENKIRRLNSAEALQNIVWQVEHRFKAVESLDLLLSHVGDLIQNIPVFELENRPEPEAVYMSYKTMHHAAEELNL